MTVVAQFKVYAARLLPPYAGVVHSNATQGLGVRVLLRVHVV